LLDFAGIFPPKTWEQLSELSKKENASEMTFQRYYPVSKVIVPVSLYF